MPKLFPIAPAAFAVCALFSAASVSAAQPEDSDRPTETSESTPRSSHFVQDGWDDGQRETRSTTDFVPDTEDSLSVGMGTGGWHSRFFASELLRHTPVTGFAPGFLSRVGYDAPGDQFRMQVDFGGNVNTAAPAAQRFDGTVAPSIGIPFLRLAEVGVGFHSIYDTQDRWRMGPIDAYLQSMILNRPNAEYFRRRGFNVFASTEPIHGFVFGAEYRSDRYTSADVTEDTWTLFNRDEPPYFTPAIDEGRMRSVVLRLDWTNRPRLRLSRNSPRRDPELPLYRMQRTQHVTLLSSNTLEIARPGLGDGGDFSFTRVVSVQQAYLPTGGDHGLTLRVRAAGGRGLPGQKAEALGGWGSIRGYGFKEFRGDFSALGTAEYRWSFISAFIDVGSVELDGTWTEARAGVGLGLELGDDFHIEAAWRTDEGAKAAPSVMAFFTRPF